MTTDNYGFIALIVSVFNLSLITVSVFLLWRQVVTAHEWNRRKATYDCIIDTNMGHFRELRRALETQRIDIYDLQQNYSTVAPNLSPDDLFTLDTILNHLENIALGIKNHITDEDIAFNCLNEIIIAYHRWAYPYIRANRALSITLWIELDPLVQRWAERRAQRQQRLVQPGKSRL